MIERKIVAQKLKEKEIETFVFSFLGRESCSRIKMQRTPLGEKITIYTSRPGLIVGRKGGNIKKITETLKTRFNMENPQLEVAEVENPNLDAASISRALINSLQRFGAKRFKALAYRALENTMKAGAKGIEVVIGGRGVPGERAKTWRFTAGYLKKSGDISENFMDRSYEACNLRSGTIGIKVSILHPDVVLPDDITQYKPTTDIQTEKQEPVEKDLEVKEKTEILEEKKEEKPKKKKITKRKVNPKSEDGNNKKE